MHDGHRDRMRSRFLEEGLDNFQPHEILELLLFYAIPRKDTNQLAHMLIQKYGSISAVFETDPHELAAIKGIGEKCSIMLSLIPAVARVYLKNRAGDKPIIDSTFKAGQYAISLFTGRIYEFFYVISLDTHNRVNHASVINKGTIDQAVVYPRLVVETALRHKAYSVILAHNHPGGKLFPSSADIESTQKLLAALASISIRVYDHIIVAGNKYLSFAEEGLIEQ